MPGLSLGNRWIDGSAKRQRRSAGTVKQLSALRFRRRQSGSLDYSTGRRE